MKLRLPWSLLFALGVLFCANTAAAKQEKMDIILVLDNSGSMKQNDPRFLTREAYKAFFKTLTPEVRVALIFFDQNVNVAMTFTEVSQQTRNRFFSHLKQLTFKGQRTNTPAAMERAIHLHKLYGRDDAIKSIILMSDGVVDTGDSTKNQTKGRWLRQELANDAVHANIHIYGIAFSERADYQLMQTLAYKTGGNYHRVFEPRDIQSAFHHVLASLRAHRKQPDSTQTSRQKEPIKANLEKPAELPAHEVVTATLELSNPIPELSTPGIDLKPPLEQPPSKQTAAAAKPESSRSPTHTVPEQRPTAQPIPEPEPSETETEILSLSTPLKILLLLLVLGVVIWMIARSRRDSHGAAKQAEAQPGSGASLKTRTEMHRKDEAFTRLIPPQTSTPPSGLSQKNIKTEVRPQSADPTIQHPVPTKRARINFHETQPKAALLEQNPEVDNPAQHTEIKQKVTVIGRIRDFIPPGIGYMLINKPSISRLHGRIEFHDASFWLEDLKSTNGTFLNGHRIQEKVPIYPGDILRFCDDSFKFVVLDGKTTKREHPLVKDL